MSNHIENLQQQEEKVAEPEGEAADKAGKKRTAWILTSGKAGMVAHCVGVADALGIDYQLKTVSPGIPWSWMAPWGPMSPSHRAGRKGSPLTPPWPDLAIASGRASIPYIRELKNAAGSKTFAVYMTDPRIDTDFVDLVWAPEHDNLSGRNVITSLTSPHAHRNARLQSLRGAAHELLDSMPFPRVMLTLGGPSSAYRYTATAINRLVRAIQDLCNLKVSFLVTPSRRTPAELLSAVELATRDRPRVLWDGQGENPYPLFLAKADYLIVTADSANMTGEACVTGRPVYVFKPDGGSKKFEKFHEALRDKGATRLLPERIKQLDDWEYEPLDSTMTIAEEIKKRW